ncbi:MAG: HAMP domain-containing sensor histidine kinase [Polyangiaceae bacterium]
MARPRLSLRIRVISAIVFVALAPHLLIVVWTQVDRRVPGHLWTNVRDAMEEARKAQDPSALAALAERRGVRLRVLRVSDEAMLADVDSDAPISLTERVEAFFLRPSNTPRLREVDDGLGPLLERDEVRSARTRGDYVACEHDWLLYCQAIGVGRDAEGRELLVHVQQSTYRAVGAAFQLRSQLVRIGLLVWPLALLLAWFTGSRIARPIERLRRQALDRSRRTAPRLEQEPGDEVGDLAAALNALIETLEAERRGHEEFVADLVHELKSTVAAVRASADTLEAGAGDERSARIARALRESSTKLDHTVGRFLDLARAEAGFPREERCAVDLGELAKGLVSRRRDDARFTDVEFSISADADATVLGVDYRLEAMLAELIENGASFSERGGHVRVAVVRSEQEVVVTVEDDGPGIPEAERDDVFRRYYTTRGHARGSGLGLTLVRAVAEAHGGQAELKQAEQGATFSVRLPAFTSNSHAAR